MHLFTNLHTLLSVVIVTSQVGHATVLEKNVSQIRLLFIELSKWLIRAEKLDHMGNANQRCEGGKGKN